MGRGPVLPDCSSPDRRRRPEFHVFDLLHLLGRDTTRLPLSDRRRLLAQLLEQVADEVHLVEAVEGDVRSLLDAACQAGWEGLIAKRAESVYRSGRSPDWRKLKCTTSQLLVVGGWTDRSGQQTGLGALLVGYYDDTGQLRYAGRVGSGFAERELVDLQRTLAGLITEKSPFVDAGPVKGSHWVRPKLVVEVTFTEWTTDGRLRHPRFEKVQADADPTEVRREAD